MINPKLDLTEHPEQQKKTKITYLDKTFTTTHFLNISDAKCAELRGQFYSKPSINKVNEQFTKLANGGKMVDKIVDYYLKGVMSKARLSTSKWSIDEFFKCNDLIRFAYGKIKNCSEFYKSTDTDIKNIKMVLRLSPSGTAAKVSNFPYKTMIQILDKYNVNNNYYDFSCGWGVRLLATLSHKINYFGTDPNSELVPQLQSMGDDFKNITGCGNSVDIRCIGSENLVTDWVNKIGLAFSSPPYFDLEYYNIGEQSINNNNYQEWLGKYWENTVNNIDKYLINGGYFILNMKNIKKHNTLDDMCDIIKNKGFTFVENLELKNINRIALKNAGVNSNEVLAVFRKGKYEKM
tara:strand:- start:381 stop:1427 length:1047 start_codon:yes stop_codon:yes gene_type:complete